jgi:hypothetical protein
MADTSDLEAVDLCKQISTWPWTTRGFEATYLDGLLIEAETRLIIDEEVLDFEAMIALELNHLAHTLGLGVANDGAIAS